MTSPSPLLSVAATCVALFATSCAESEPYTPPDGSPPRTVVLISLDTLRPDRLGVYGNDAGVSPHLDALADDAIVYERCFAPAPWTLPSHMSMLTGLDPVAHGMRNGDHRLAPGIVTLAEALTEEGFLTAAFTDGGYVGGEYGFVDGFDTFNDERVSDDSDPDDLMQRENGWERILPNALDWLDDLEDDERAFLFLHTFDAHAPFRDDVSDPDVLAEFRKRPVRSDPRDHRLPHLEHFTQQAKFDLHRYLRIGELLNDYDAGVHIADRGTGAILDALRASGRYDDALVIVTSDHGESMLEQRLHVGHGMFLSNDETHVPLLVKLPQQRHAGTRSDQLVDLVDIAPTVLDVVDAPTVDDMQGESLAALADGAERERTIFLQQSGNIATFALMTPEYRYHTPVFGLPMQIARRHLGAVTPPMGEFFKAPIAKGPNAGQVLEYDKRTDPLGVNDHFIRTEELYELDAETYTMTDLAQMRPAVVETLRESFLDALDASIALGDELVAREGAGVKSQMSDEDRKKLEALGYLDPDEKPSASEDGPPDPRLHERKMRETLPLKVARLEREAYAAPDVEALAAVDRQVHQLRVALADGADLPRAEITRRCTDAAERYAAWAAENENGLPRIIWRLFDLNDLAVSAGVSLDLDDLVPGR